jgi:hypothetical protein
MPRKQIDQEQPMLGIFWLFNSRLIVNTSPLSKAERFGDFLGHPPSHLDYWTGLQRRGEVPLDIEYEDCSCIIVSPRCRSEGPNPSLSPMVERLEGYTDAANTEEDSWISMRAWSSISLEPTNGLLKYRMLYPT